MNLVDSCGWLEYFADGPNADFFAPALENSEQLLVPSICILEVFRHILRHRGEGPALSAVSAMQQGRVVDLDAPVAMTAARLGVELGLPRADSVILATARLNEAIVWTQDADFKGIKSVKYKPHRS
jgi:predicted nucleic acid-binding protein